ncbi:MAG: hypothetical protein PHG00_06140 [Methylococcales bacterium]|nr:hypothetical protein [Methylococcales bacterium]
MQWLFELFIDQNSVPHALLIISLVISTGLALGRISLFGVELGIAGGTVFGAYFCISWPTGIIRAKMSIILTCVRCLPGKICWLGWVTGTAGNKTTP